MIFTFHNRFLVKKLYSIYQFLDSAWCSNTQLPSSFLFEITDNELKSKRLAFLRIYCAIGLFLELIGYSLITFGFYSWRFIAILLTGVVFKLLGTLISSWSQNKSGVLWNLELQNSLANLKTHTQEIYSILTNKGCSEIEINALSGLPAEVYQTEINSYQRARLLNLCMPISCGIALFLSGDNITAFIVIALGFFFISLGRAFF